MNTSLGYAAMMLGGFALLRTGIFNTGTPRFGTWRQVPRWARLLLGNVDGDIAPFRLFPEMLCLVWGLVFTVDGLTGGPPGPPLRQITATIALAALAVCGVAMAAASIGQAVRQWRSRRADEPRVK